MPTAYYSILGPKSISLHLLNGDIYAKKNFQKVAQVGNTEGQAVPSTFRNLRIESQDS